MRDNPRQPDDDHDVSIGDPPPQAEPIKVYEDRTREREGARHSREGNSDQNEQPPAENRDDEETMPMEEGFSIVP